MFVIDDLIALFAAAAEAAPAATAAAAPAATTAATAATAAELAAAAAPAATTAAAAPTIAAEVAAGVPAAGAPVAAPAAAAAPVTPPAGLEQIGSGFSTELPAGFDQQLQGVQNIVQNAGPGTQFAGPATAPAGSTSLNPYISAETGEKFMLDRAPLAESVYTPPAAPEAAYQSVNPNTYALNSPSTAPGSPGLQYQLNPPSSGGEQGLRLGTSTEGLKAPANAANSLYQTPGPTGFDKAAKFATENKFLTGATAYTAAYKLGLLDPKMPEEDQGQGYGYKMADDFKASSPTPTYYSPSYKTYAGGGVMSVGGPSSEVPEPRKVINPMATLSADYGDMPGYAGGGTTGSKAAKDDGTLSDSLNFYRQLAEPAKVSAPEKSDVGIYHDSDMDTRTQDALTAAQTRMAKVNKRANMQTPSMKRPTPMGQLNLAPPGAKAQQGGADTTEAAQGGIMQARDSSLGGYAAGGNPRLLKGPGDGMSDNIPAMIGRKQPARLADGEFVIPADVVSHLGNGSTEAGAKRLHEMMTKVRRDRTGNPKQGKQINAAKYMPK